MSQTNKYGGGYTNRRDQGLRCTESFCETGRDPETGMAIRPPLSVEDIKLENLQGPNPVIAKITRCHYCGKLYRLEILDGAREKFGFTSAALVALLNKSHTTSFSFSELKAGRVTQVHIPEAAPRQVERVTLVRHPDIAGLPGTASEVYNPDKFIEPEMFGEDVPL